MPASEYQRNSMGRDEVFFTQYSDGSIGVRNVANGRTRLIPALPPAETLEGPHSHSSPEGPTHMERALDALITSQPRNNGRISSGLSRPTIAQERAVSYTYHTKEFTTDDNEEIDPFDTGNIRAICFSLDSGIDADGLFKFIQKLSPTFEEIESIVKMYNGYFSMSEERKKTMMTAFDRYAAESKTQAKRYPCQICGKKKVYWNLIDINAKKSENKTTTKMSVCSSCFKGLRFKKLQCPRHAGAYAIGKERPVCPLYPKKCVPERYCNQKECLNAHMGTHKGYVARKWKATKRLHSSQPGTIITSNLLTGVEYEVVAKNKETTRENIFKLGRRIGIDHDSSIDSFHLATELVTPPASGRKLEDLIRNSSEALMKDGFVVNVKCGLHIHVDLFRKYGHININPDFYKSLLAAYVIFENSFWRLVPGYRAANPNLKAISRLYAPQMHDVKYINTTKFSKIWYRVNEDNYVMAYRNQKRHESKRYWANFHSLLRKEGLEIRIMEGTIDAESILWWIRLNHEFIKRVSEDQQLYTRFTKLSEEYNRDSRGAFLKFMKADPELMKFIEKREMIHKNSDREAIQPDEGRLREIIQSNREGRFISA